LRHTILFVRSERHKRGHAGCNYELSTSSLSHTKLSLARTSP